MSRRRVAWFLFALGAELLLFGALNLFDDWTLEQMPVRFVAAALACGIAYLFATSRFHSAFPLRKQALLLWTVAILLRIAALPLEPGDDFWRYQWEGKIQLAGFNPYVLAPADAQLEKLRADFPAWGKINHREFAAIYPPGTELLFHALSRITDSPLLYKLLFAAADLGTIAVLVRLIGGPGRYAGAAWYAWNPLVVYSFAGAAHFDSLMILPTVAGILLLTRYESTSDSRQKWLLATGAAALFGLAVSIKLIPLLLLPLCMFALRSRAPVLLVSLGLPAALSVFYGWPHVPIWDSLRGFAYVTRVNDLFWWIVEETVWPNPRQKNYHYNVVIVTVVLLLSVLFWRNWKRGLLWVLGAALILTPVLHPWYCTWILPFAAWRRVPAWQVLSVSLFAYYLFWNERLFTLPWHTELWMRAIIILPPVLALLLLARRRADATAVVQEPQ
ncbi:MAG TPA: hypothetical protein VGP40_01805 [Chthoniobacterales bacterium]|nr:hypothetical protein [Chthoniobacterales bacterium]